MGKFYKDKVEIDQFDLYNDIIDDMKNGDHDWEDDYKNDLDTNGEVEAGGYLFLPSRILKELDPIAYDLGYDDFLNYHAENFIEELELGQIEEYTIGDIIYTYEEDEDHE